MAENRPDGFPNAWFADPELQLDETFCDPRL